MIIHMRHTLWTGISETNVNFITSATRKHAFNNNNNILGFFTMGDHLGELTEPVTLNQGSSIYIYNSVPTCRQHIINSSASAPPNATKIAVKKVSDVDVRMFGPEL